MGAAATVPIADARALLLGGLGLLDDPSGLSGDGAVRALVDRLGFVQVDSINVVERAHHHILWTRMHSYRPRMLERALHEGEVFEHWTHDASVIPTAWFPHWRHRFARVESWAWAKWLQEKLGRRREQVLTEVLDRVRREGPVMARDFEEPGRRNGPWWDWKPAKAALEYWWRAGELAIARRVNFHKVYDLTERALPRVHGLPAPSPEEHVTWACRTAMERLNVATPREIAAFWGAITASQAREWCALAVERGLVVPVRVGAGSDRAAFAPPDWRTRAERARGAIASSRTEMRLLSPFDPLIRDRARCARLLGFNYSFEAFVTEKKRRYGYYVLPILQGDRLVGRLDPRLDRKAGVLRVRRVWWEDGVRPTRARLRALDRALALYAAFNGVAQFEIADARR